MKISISVPDDAIEFLDSQTETGKFPSRSAAIAAGIRLLRANALGNAYEAAWSEWTESGEADIWEEVAADGMPRSSR